MHFFFVKVTSLTKPVHVSFFEQVASGKMSKAKAIREFKAGGNKAMASGSFLKASRQYTKALELDPGSAILYSNRSAAHFNLRQFPESLEDAESAILCDAMWWKAYKRKGLSLIHMQRYAEAITALEEGLKIVEVNAEMKKNLEFARACQEQAQNLYILPEPHKMKRLESVPIFIVTDDVGQPFFITYDDDQQVCTFYFDKADAMATLDWIKEENTDLGDTARVIHITLNQAFNLAQETQKQYYEDATRAAVEEDRRNAAASKDSVLDVDDDQEQVSETVLSGRTPEESQDVTSADGKTDENKEEPSVDEDKEKDGGGDEDKLGDGDDFDENAPLSFQFRPALSQVQIAVDLLNQQPEPKIRPILRDPPSVKKAKELATTSAAEKTSCDDNEPNKPTSATSEKSATSEGEATVAAECKDSKGEGDGETPKDDGANDDGSSDGDVELSVDNFNGIPIFQAKGLTLLQNNEQLLPLFFSKKDLDVAWNQLVQSQAVGVPKECEVEVGTLEDVLRRISESKTKEFDNICFVPAREAMEAIGAKYPLDDLAVPKSMEKPVARKATFSKAKQVAARGGSKEEVREAIREDLDLAVERQRMAEIIAQIEIARRQGNGPIYVDPQQRSGRVDRTMRRTAERLERKRAARNASRQQLTSRGLVETAPRSQAPTTPATSTVVPDTTAAGEATVNVE